jgi:hypothetical protein
MLCSFTCLSIAVSFGIAFVSLFCCSVKIPPQPGHMQATWEYSTPFLSSLFTYLSINDHDIVLFLTFDLCTCTRQSVFKGSSDGSDGNNNNNNNNNSNNINSLIVLYLLRLRNCKNACPAHPSLSFKSQLFFCLFNLASDYVAEV